MARFFVMFTLGGCIKYDNPEKQQEKMYKKFKAIYDYIDENRDFLEIEYIFEQLALIQQYAK